jgi:hypothetical protein
MNDAEVDQLLERFDQTEPALQRRIVAQVVSDRFALALALAELVKLQAHYAGLLNDFDGGRRVAFESAQAWLDRLAELGTIPAGVRAEP